MFDTNILVEIARAGAGQDNKETTGMTALECYQILRRLHDGRQHAIDQYRGNRNLTAEERRTAIGAAVDESIALEMALDRIATHLSGHDLCMLDDEERHQRRDRLAKYRSATLDYGG